MAAKKIKPRAVARKKELQKEKVRYELRRKTKKNIKKQMSALIPKENTPLNKEEIASKKESLSLFYKTLDSNVSKGLITKGRANRLKSRYSKKLNILMNPKSEETNTTKSK
ncbi:30S ribosomal protein S20 [Candidatus Mycoplasma haematolamae str. Purdue]|uniref:Small ribosomal subunit protein bS20 n=1 Tax=Mycoplasma haematolamae (strain Purdue) TaxID=1212765 RepID=I7C655_MYCHA|nr:30S ribosomal protein S20 [Candidatus Mycoplasma haematolamae]AFO51962.1 30S ribosomal protein S20 [Candidatus Mycoplasma haematolamae str. Purdue]